MEEKKFDKDINVRSKDDTDINIGMTDEEIKDIRYDLVLQKGVAGLDGFARVPHSKLIKWLYLIDYLQNDYSNLKERYVKVLDLNEKVIAEQKAEIERLKTFIDFKTANVMCDKCKQQTEKYTAKRILDELDLFFKGTTFRNGYEFKKIDEKLKEIAKRNGVEVE
jgi:hypothetical protein